MADFDIETTTGICKSVFGTIMPVDADGPRDIDPIEVEFSRVGTETGDLMVRNYGIFAHADGEFNIINCFNNNENRPGIPSDEVLDFILRGSFQDSGYPRDMTYVAVEDLHHQIQVMFEDDEIDVDAYFELAEAVEDREQFSIGDHLWFLRCLVRAFMDNKADW